MAQDAFGRHFSRACPGIEIGQSEKNRDEQKQHQWQRQEPRLQEAPRWITPSTTGELMNHCYEETTQRQSNPKQPSEQIGEEELSAIEKCSHGRQRKGNQTNDEKH